MNKSTISSFLTLTNVAFKSFNLYLLVSLPTANVEYSPYPVSPDNLWSSTRSLCGLFLVSKWITSFPEELKYVTHRIINLFWSMNEWEKNTALSFFILLLRWVPTRHFYGKGHVFPRELIKKPQKIYVSTGYFQFQNLQKMYTLSHFLYFNLNWYLVKFLLKELSQDNLKVY